MEIFKRHKQRLQYCWIWGHTNTRRMFFGKKNVVQFRLLQQIGICRKGTCRQYFPFTEDVKTIHNIVLISFHYMSKN